MDNAADLIPIPPWSADRMSDFFDITIKDALMHGLTSIHDADVYDASTAFYKRFVLVPFATVILADIWIPRISEECKSSFLPDLSQNRLYLMSRGTLLLTVCPHLLHPLCKSKAAGF